VSWYARSRKPPEWFKTAFRQRLFTTKEAFPV
jgi:hypothetical protein